MSKILERQLERIFKDYLVKIRGATVLRLADIITRAYRRATGLELPAGPDFKTDILAVGKSRQAAVNALARERGWRLGSIGWMPSEAGLDWLATARVLNAGGLALDFEMQWIGGLDVIGGAIVVMVGGWPAEERKKGHRMAPVGRRRP